MPGLGPAASDPELDPELEPGLEPGLGPEGKDKETLRGQSNLGCARG